MNAAGFLIVKNVNPVQEAYTALLTVNIVLTQGIRLDNKVERMTAKSLEIGFANAKCIHTGIKLLFKLQVSELKLIAS